MKQPFHPSRGGKPPWGEGKPGWKGTGSRREEDGMAVCPKDRDLESQVGGKREFEQLTPFPVR